RRRAAPAVKVRYSKRPATRARTSTSLEPAVCPTYSNVTGSACGATVTTVTSGGGMPAPGPPLCPPLSDAPSEGLHAARARARPASKPARKTRSVMGGGELLRRERKAILLHAPCFLLDSKLI